MKGKCEGVKYDPEDVNLTSKNYATTCWNKKKKIVIINCKKHFEANFVPWLKNASGNI